MVFPRDKSYRQAEGSSRQAHMCPLVAAVIKLNTH